MSMPPLKTDSPPETPLEAGANTIRTFARDLPETPGVYQMLGADNKPLYIGKARKLQRRVLSYTRPNRLPLRLKRMIARTKTMQVTHTRSEAEALLLESNMIKRHQPPFNIRLKDDKAAPYILITQDHDFPLLTKHRGAQRRKGQYYGPFATASTVYETILALQKAFRLRNCSDAEFERRKRPCLQYHIKRCTAPCVGKISKADYAKDIQTTRDFLSGKSNDIQSGLAEKMQAASDAQNFEDAARFRDQIKALTQLQAKQAIHVAHIVKDADVIGLHRDGGVTAIQHFIIRAGRNYGSRSYFPKHDAQADTGEVLTAFLAQYYQGRVAPRNVMLSHEPDDLPLLEEALNANQDEKWRVHITIPQRGEKMEVIRLALESAAKVHSKHMQQHQKTAKLLEGVKALFDLPKIPERIEVYDNSHTGGTNQIGAMIVAGSDGFIKQAYRKFTIKGEMQGGDDYAMMEEVLERRFGRALKEDPERVGENWPDLILIDGGKGQLSSAVKVMTALGLIDLPLVAISKGEDRNAGREEFHQVDKTAFQLPIRDPVLYYLQRLRDEAHRFAITTHRHKRSKAMIKSSLDDVPGVGPKRKKALLHHFGSAKAVKAARVEDLTRVEGISEATAQGIVDWFNG